MRKKQKKRTIYSIETDRCFEYAENVCSGEIIAGPYIRGACRRHLNDYEKSLSDDYPYQYDFDIANNTYRFIEENLYLNSGQFEGKPFKLFLWECFIAGSIFGWVNKGTGLRRFNTAYIETGKGPLSISTPIATLHGWKTMGEITIGDVVFDSLGRPTKVIAISPIFYNRKCYKLTFSDGDTIVADASHEWYTAALRNGKLPGHRGGFKKGDYEKKTTEYIKKTLRIKESSSVHPQAKWNHRVDVAPYLDLGDVKLPINPYTLGVWLGDGYSDGARITVPDEEIIENIKNDGYFVGKKQNKINCKAFRLSIGIRNPYQCPRGHEKTGSRCLICERHIRFAHRHNIPISPRTNLSLNEIINSIGLKGNKHIPSMYFRAGTNQRLSLLQGIMDSDGHVASKGHCEITLCNYNLCSDVADLLRTLGFKCNIKESDAKLNGKIVGKRWRISFQAYKSFPPVRLNRKLSNLADEPKTRPLSRGRMIIGCEPVESVPVKCITVESSDHMFLAGRNLIPTCNSGKSPLAASIGIKGMVADKEPRAEVYAAATYKDQAKVLFGDALAFYDQSPRLQEKLTPSGTGNQRWQLQYKEKGSFFKILSTDTPGGRGHSGPRPHIALCDEIHEHKDGNVIRMLKAGFKFRRQPILFMITNSGNNKECVCWEYHEAGRKIACEMSDNDEFFAFICSLDDEDLEDDQFLDNESCWIKANPSLDDGLPGYDYLRKQVKETRDLPGSLSTVKRLNFCVWVESENPAISAAAWTACEDNNYPDSILIGRRCWGGLDLSAVNDLTAFALMFEPIASDLFWRLRVWFWVPGEGLHRKEELDHVPYVAWRDAGFIKAIPRKTIDYEFVISDMLQIFKTLKINPEKIAFDRWNKKVFDKEVDRMGVTLPEIVEFGQGYQSMSPAVKVFETKLIEGTMRHNGNPCLRWNASNVVAVKDAAENKKYDKSKSTGRIDGIISSVMCCGILEEVVASGLQERAHAGKPVIRSL